MIPDGKDADQSDAHQDADEQETAFEIEECQEVCTKRSAPRYQGAIPEVGPPHLQWTRPIPQPNA
jgi:hypothetical protein